MRSSILQWLVTLSEWIEDWMFKCMSDEQKDCWDEAWFLMSCLCIQLHRRRK
jgi:hypothetical protein